jgi:hypothetical protein
LLKIGETAEMLNITLNLKPILEKIDGQISVVDHVGSSPNLRWDRARLGAG